MRDGGTEERINGTYVSYLDYKGYGMENQQGIVDGYVGGWWIEKRMVAREDEDGTGGEGGLKRGWLRESKKAHAVRPYTSLPAR